MRKLKNNKKMKQYLYQKRKLSFLKKGGDTPISDDSKYLIMSFNTTNKTVELPLYSGGDYNGTEIDWGDGNSEVLSSDANLLHTYSEDGIYDVKIYKEMFPGINVAGLSSYSKWFDLIELKQWGKSKFFITSKMFNYARNCVFSATDIPDLSQCFYSDFMFSNADLFNQNINSWNLSNIYQTKGMFSSARAFNNGGVDLNIDLTNAEDLSYFFNYCDLSGINITLNNTSNVTNTSNMFKYTKFSGVLNMDASKVYNLSYMFAYSSFNNDLTLNTQAANLFNNMFIQCTSLNGNINLNYDSATNLSLMFSGCSSFNKPMSFNIPIATDIKEMFYNCSSLNSPMNFNIPNVSNIRNMFASCSSLNSDITFTNNSNVVDMTGLFDKCYVFNSNIYFDNFNNTNLITDSMFRNAKRFNKPLPQNLLDNVYKGAWMFQYTEDFNQPLDFSNNTKIYESRGMFNYAKAFNQPLDFTAATYQYFNMSYMFRDATAFNSSFDAAINYNNAINDLFKNASSFNQPITLDFTIADNLDEFVLGTAMSPINYANFLIKLNNETTSTGKTLNSGILTYDSSAQTAVDSLINDKGWTINDGGVAS